jgi:hypothetical protein
MSNLDSRIKDALGAAARTVPESVARPRVEALRLRPTFRPPWPVVAIVAAVAVGLAFAIPYNLLRGGSDEPLPAQSPTAGDPPPLRAVELKRVGTYYLEHNNNVAPDAAGEKIAVAGVGKQTTQNPDDYPRLPGAVYTASVQASDGRTFYVARNTGDANCTADVHKLELAENGSVKSLVLVPGTKVAGRKYFDLQVSPDGKQLAMTVKKQVYNGHYCDPDEGQPGVAVLDLATGSWRTWTNEGGGHDPWGGGNGKSIIAWSFDSKSLVFPWPLRSSTFGEDEETALRKLDVSAPEGPLEQASKAIPVDKEFAASGRTRLELMTAGLGEYPPELAAFQTQGGNRILAVAGYPRRVPGEQSGKSTHPPLPGWVESYPINPPRIEPGLVEISLVTGKTRDVPR